MNRFFNRLLGGFAVQWYSGITHYAPSCFGVRTLRQAQCDAIMLRGWPKFYRVGKLVAIHPATPVIQWKWEALNEIRPPHIYLHESTGARASKGMLPGEGE